MADHLNTGTDEALQLDRQTCRELLFRMKRIRLVEEAIAERYHNEKMRCPTHLSVGQEMPAAVAGMLLRKDDLAVSSHRGHAHYLAKGGDLKQMLAEIHGKASGCSRGKGGSMHLIDRSVGFVGCTAIVGSTIPVGVGLGLSIKLQRTDQVSCIFLGDGAVEEGVFYESVSFAALKKLPVLFFCENNFYSVYSHIRKRQPEGRRIHEMVEAIGVESSFYGGSDVGEFYGLAGSLIDEIRAGGGPRFIEVLTYRWREHCGPNYDNQLGYRTEEEFLTWKKRDPLTLFEKYLLAEKSIGPEDLDQMDRKIQEEIEEAFQFAEQSPFPDRQEAYKHLYQE